MKPISEMNADEYQQFLLFDPAAAVVGNWLASNAEYQKLGVKPEDALGRAFSFTNRE